MSGCPAARCANHPYTLFSTIISASRTAYIHEPWLKPQASLEKALQPLESLCDPSAPDLVQRDAINGYLKLTRVRSKVLTVTKDATSMTGLLRATHGSRLQKYTAERNKPARKVEYNLLSATAHADRDVHVA